MQLFYRVSKGFEQVGEYDPLGFGKIGVRWTGKVEGVMGSGLVAWFREARWVEEVLIKLLGCRWHWTRAELIAGS